MKTRILVIVFFCALLSAVRGQFAGTFVHPGGMHTQVDFSRMAAKVSASQSPWVDSYNALTNVSMANTNWAWAPVIQIIRGGSGGNYARSQLDALAIYYNALRWRVTGNTNFATKAISGCDAWSSTMTNGVGGDSNWALGAGICGYEFAVAGETLRGYTNWSQNSISNYCNFLRLFAGGNQSFLTNHNGTCDSHYWCNWDACNLASLISCGVFLDDTNLFNQAVTYLKQGRGNGNLTSAAWYIHTNGLAQWEESGRDQAHALDGVMWLAVALQVAWNQGVDLYSFDNNHYLRGIEYVAKYNLFNNVPFAVFGTCDASEGWGTAALSSGSRGITAAIWDLMYNHYVNIMGLDAPWTAAMAAANRPDGYSNSANSPDCLCFSTLTCYLDPISVCAVPGGVTASVSGTNVALTWWGSAYATNYLVKRATVSGGPYTTIASVAPPMDRYFADNTVTNGGTYYYVISEQDKFGESPNSPEKSAAILNQLVVYYKFNESGGTNSSDSSGFGQLPATLMSNATFIAGKVGNAVNLNGTTQYVALPYGLTKGLNDFTIAAWVYWNGGSSWQRIFDFGADIDRYMFLTPSDGSTIRFAISKFSGNGEQQINGTAALPNGGWHHVAVTLQGTGGGGVGILYVDGLPVGTNASMSYTPDMIGSLINATNCWIGRSQFSGDPYLNGKVDEFRIYNGALSAAQITALYTLSPVTPQAPATLNAAAISANQINLSWAAVNEATYYIVQRSVSSGGPYAIVASGSTATNYIDTGLTGSTTYFYVVNAVNSGGSSTNSVQGSAITLTPPLPPTSLIATGYYGGLIVLSWNPSVGATSYNVKRAIISGGPYVNIATGVTAANYTNSGLVFNATYYYVVSAVNANGESPNSNETNSVVPVPGLSWVGNVNTNWDIATTTNWLFSGSPSTYFTDGATVNFNDSASNNVINLIANVSPYSVAFSNSALAYIVSSSDGSGIGGSATLSKSGSGSLTLVTTNTFTGGISINGGGTLAIGGSGLLGVGNYSGNIMNYGTFNYNSSASQILSGNISLSGAVSKNGAGALTFMKPNDYSGSTIVNSGQLTLTGSGGILESSAILIGNTSGASAAVWQSGASTKVNPVSGLNGLQIGSTPGGYGYYNLSSGTVNLASEMHVGGNSGGAGTFGQFDMTGGNVIMPNSTASYFILNRGAAGESSVANFAGGTVNVSLNGTPAVSGANGFGANWAGSGAAQTNTATISGTAQFITPSLDVFLNVGGNSANVCNLNLNGGTLQTLSIQPAAGLSRVNFNGGTLKAGVSGGLLVGGVQSALLYSNGATIDDNGQAVAIDQPLQAPVGNGIASLPVSNAGAGYVAPPQVLITGGGGSNATAYAMLSGGAITGINITCPGMGYTSVPVVALVGGGYTTAATLGTPTLIPNVGGGLTKLGSGTLTLGGTNTYTGTTVIGAGTLKLGGPLLYLSFDNTNGTTVINQGSGGPIMNGTLTGTNVTIVAGGHSGKALYVSNGPVNTGYVLINSPVMNLNNNSTWTWGMWIKTSTAGAAFMYQGSGGWASGNTSFYLNTGNATSGTKGGGVRNSQGWETGTTALNDGNWHYIVMTCSAGTKTFYVDGAVDSWTVNGWSGNGTGNQLWIGGTADTGDGNAPFNGLIDDVSIFGRALSQSEITNLMAGIKSTSPALPATANVAVNSGATLLLDTAGQTIGSLSGGNSGNVQLAGAAGTAFTFGNASNTVFAGAISGNGNVTKNGAGSITFSGANTYSGATIINAGTVKFGQSDSTNYVGTLGPLLWFNFDQGVDLIDGIVTNLGLGGSVMNGAFNGNATITSGGRYGNALSLDGVSDLIVNNEVTPLDCNTTGASWTYALWIKTATPGVVYGYQGDGTWNTGATTFYLNNNNSSSGGAKAGGVRVGDNWLTGTTTLDDNTWHFVTITVSGGIKTIYIDGNVEAQTGTTGWKAPAMTYANQFWIGASPDSEDGTASFNGLIDEVYLFNRALSRSEVQNIMANAPVDSASSVTGQLPVVSPVILAASAVLDLSGTTQTLASLSDTNGNGGLVTNSIGAATLVLNNNSTNTFTGQICDSPGGTALGVTKIGNGTQFLNGTNSYSGNTTVNGGTLALGVAALPTNGIVAVTNGAILSLNFAGTNLVASLILNGITQSPGVFNAANSSPFITGTGSLLVPNATSTVSNPVATDSPAIIFSVSGNLLTVSWPSNHIGWRLQSQTNLAATNWLDVAGATVTNLIIISPTNSGLFYRLIYP